MTSAPRDPVRDFLRRSGAPPGIVAQGFRGLVEHWERVVERIAGGQDQRLEDYLNDMDTRQLLANAMGLVPAEIGAVFAARVAAADGRLRQQLVPAGRCLWGAIAAADMGLREGSNWWYFERPRAPGPMLRHDLEGS
ncbi:MAG: hypothetical protein OEW17_02140 [Gemmatimonadota bacterium]|nr:hypothetical protein [Gemmatimonadota bacterium]MDH4347580.1 hypothetical protein [Gemmatimonadota bacterium]MDH5284415.1 hypothetical protein [Gemmatimonadota bacterium]